MHKLIHKSIKIGLMGALMIIMTSCMTVDEYIASQPLPNLDHVRASDCSPNCSYENKEWTDWGALHNEWLERDYRRKRADVINEIQREQGDW